MVASPREANARTVADSRRVGPDTGRSLPFVVVTVLVVSFAVVFPAGVRAQQSGAGDTTHVDSPAPSPAARPRPALAVTSSPAGSSITSWPDEIEAPADSLPFARNPIPLTYPSFAVEIGLADFRSGFQGADRAFRAIEDTIRASGSAVPASTGVKSASMFLFTFDVRLNPAFDAALQIGESKAKDNRLRLVGGLVSGRYTLPQDANVSLLAGLGAGVYRLRLQRHYGVLVTSVGGSGYTTLDYIRLEGGGAYGTIAGQLEVRVGPYAAFEGVVQYFGMSDFSTNAGSTGRMSVNTNGTMFGLSFRIVL